MIRLFCFWDGVSLFREGFEWLLSAGIKVYMHISQFMCRFFDNYKKRKEKKHKKENSKEYSFFPQPFSIYCIQHWAFAILQQRDENAAWFLAGVFTGSCTFLYLLANCKSHCWFCDKRAEPRKLFVKKFFAGVYLTYLICV